MTITDHTPTAVTLPLGTWRIDPVHSTVGFEVRDMAHLFATVHGRFTDYVGVIEVSPEGARASGTIRVASLSTDHSERDENLRSPQFLDATASPEMRFESDAFEVAPDGTARIAGRLDLKGTPSDLDLTGRVLGIGVDHTGTERLAIAVEGDFPFGPMKVRLVVDVSAVRADQIT
jgi:polyisoprenoid-binding protein YceI